MLQKAPTKKKVIPSKEWTPQTHAPKPRNLTNAPSDQVEVSSILFKFEKKHATPLKLFFIFPRDRRIKLLLSGALIYCTKNGCAKNQTVAAVLNPCKANASTFVIELL